MLCVDSLPVADAGRWARPGFSIVRQTLKKEASNCGQSRLVHTSRRDANGMLAAPHHLPSTIGHASRPLCRMTERRIRCSWSRPLHPVDLQRSGRQNGFCVGPMHIDALLRSARRVGSVRDDGQGAGKPFCRAGRPTERGSGELAVSSRSFVMRGGDLGGVILYPPSHPGVVTGENSCLL